MAGAQSYYHHAGDFRNGSAGDGLPPCVGESVANNYSTLLYASEAGRIVRWHAQTNSAAERQDGKETATTATADPLFTYLAFQSVRPAPERILPWTLSSAWRISRSRWR